MDALSSAFGGLSAGAGEWRPGQGAGGAGSSPSQEQQQQLQLQQQQRVNVNAHDSLSSGFAAAVSLPTFIPGVGLGPAEDPAAAAASAMGGGMGGDEQQPISTTTVAPPPPATPLANPRTLLSLGLPEDMWEHYRDLDMEASRQIAPDDPRHNAVPPTYVNAYPLDEDERLQPGISGRKRDLGLPRHLPRGREELLPPQARLGPLRLPQDCRHRPRRLDQRGRPGHRGRGAPN